MKRKNPMDLWTVFSTWDGSYEQASTRGIPELFKRVVTVGIARAGGDFPEVLPDGAESVRDVLEALHRINESGLNGLTGSGVGETRALQANLKIRAAMQQGLACCYGDLVVHHGSAEDSGTDGGWRPGRAGVHVPVTRPDETSMVYYVGLALMSES